MLERWYLQGQKHSYSAFTYSPIRQIAKYLHCRWVMQKKSKVNLNSLFIWTKIFDSNQADFSLIHPSYHDQPTHSTGCFHPFPRSLGTKLSQILPSRPRRQQYIVLSLHYHCEVDNVKDPNFTPWPEELNFFIHQLRGQAQTHFQRVAEPTERKT